MKRIPTLLACLAMASAAVADTGQTLTVGGTVVDKFVTSLTFSGDNVVMTFEDGTTQTEDMALVSIDLTYDGGTSAITDVTTTAAGSQTRVYTLSGQYVGNTTEGLARGLYIVNGKKLIIQ